jgi:hypothetical protein
MTYEYGTVCSEMSAQQTDAGESPKGNNITVCLLSWFLYITTLFVLILYLVLSIGVQLKADSVHRIYVHSLCDCMLKQVLEVTPHKSQNV